MMCRSLLATRTTAARKRRRSLALRRHDTYPELLAQLGPQSRSLAGRRTLPTSVRLERRSNLHDIAKSPPHPLPGPGHTIVPSAIISATTPQSAHALGTATAGRRSTVANVVHEAVQEAGLRPQKEDCLHQPRPDSQGRPQWASHDRPADVWILD